MSSPEKEFITKFLTLATLNPPMLPSDYKKPLHEVVNLGVALPPLRYKYDHKRAKLISPAGNESSDISLSLKSIRPPKFVHTKSFSKMDTIHVVKQFLVDEVETLQDPSQLKLLLKGKVLHDSVLLSDLKADKAELTVMISKLDKSSTPIPTTPPIEELQSLREMPWQEIKELLESKFGSQKESSKALERLKKGWSLTEEN